MGSAGDWCLLESDPGVFTTLIRLFGATGVQVDEVYTLDDFDNLKPVYGLIFLFKYIENEEPSGPIVQDNRLDKIYFAKQVINNACATQAVVSLLLNCNQPHFNLGPELTTLKDFSMSFDPNMRGLTLSNSQTIRASHNSLSRHTLFEMDGKSGEKDEDVYHFIGYIPIDGRLYELDGLREGPIDHGPIAANQDWLEVAKPILMKRINKYTEGEIHFNLMALGPDRKAMYTRQLEELMNSSDHELEMHEVQRYRMLIELEEEKIARYKKEIARRRHNYLPFIIELLKILGEQKMLTPLYERAKQKVAQKSAKKAKV